MPAILGISVLLTPLYSIAAQEVRPAALPPSATPATNTAKIPAPGADLQAILNRGEDLLLEKGKVYPLRNPLRYTKPGQRISTAGAVHLADYATLRIVDAQCTQAVNGGFQDRVVLEHVVLDGNRYELSYVAKDVSNQALVQFGGRAQGQVIRECVLVNCRSWSSLKIHEGGSGAIVESNIILGAGVDPRGNGREEREMALAWGDAISCAGRDTVVRNNLIIDPTDVGIVLFGAPGSIAEDNVVASVSRESLGGINMVDCIVYNIDKDPNRCSYTGSVVRNNLIDVRGSRIHIAVPMGTAIWGPGGIGKVLVGGSVFGNTIMGGAGGYGFVASGLDGWTITGNTSTASYSGMGEGRGPKDPPADPAAFLYAADEVKNSTLQPEFLSAKRHLVHLLRCNHGRKNAMGFRYYPYGEQEAPAVVRTAYAEMLGRAPSTSELAQGVAWLQGTQGTADELRRQILMSKEFTDRFGFIPASSLHPWRVKRWFDALDTLRRNGQTKQGVVPSAKELYRSVWEQFAK
jgi:hypothetical protein